ncbi:MAG: 16S rRNA (guanine(527)-N(7))-methyltransferase RsmG [Stappiaceae bacterium]
MDSIKEVKQLIPVSRETEERLETYIRLLRRWQPVQNLVAPATLDVLWRRHVADSVQTHLAVPDARRWLDLGSGAGFPGLVTAILLADQPGSVVHLVESNQRKAAFLRTVIRETGVPAQVHPGRIEDVTRNWRAPLDGISARALASLDVLCGHAHEFVMMGATAVFHKGRDYKRELEEAAHNWTLDLVKQPSQVDDEGRLLVINRIVARTFDESTA